MRAMHWLAAAAVALTTMTTHATLIARDLNGDQSTAEAYFDDVLNVTWLADWKHSRTSGQDADGRMSWAAANAWAQGLSLGGYTGWRLPAMVDTGTPGCNFAFSGTDCGYSVLTASGSTVYSEMAHLFHVTLGNLSELSPTGTEQAGWGLSDSGPFVNMEAGTHWSGLNSVFGAWEYNFYRGFQGPQTALAEMPATAVHDGDIGRPVDAAAVPAPPAMALALVGLAALGIEPRRPGRASQRRRRSPSTITAPTTISAPSTCTGAMR